LNTVHADITESLRLASEANKDMSVELDAMRGAANSYKMHYEETERKYKIAVAEREANVEGFIETLDKQRADIERLTAERDNEHRCYLHICEDLKQAINRNITAKSEAIKEFAKNIKKHFYQTELIEYIDSLVEEVEMGLR
jgi:hypothetical protein